jgi:hypothetical protein
MSAAPFDCTVDAVYALAPETERLTDGATSRMPTPITEATVAGWITDVGAQVAGALPRLATISPGPRPRRHHGRLPGGGGLRRRVLPGGSPLPDDVRAQRQQLPGRALGPLSRGPAGGSAAAGRRHRAGRARGAGRRADARAVLGVP